jgi:hypothetical protein
MVQNQQLNVKKIMSSPANFLMSLLAVYRIAVQNNSKMIKLFRKIDLPARWASRQKGLSFPK